jgi:hypothetical protein
VKEQKKFKRIVEKIEQENSQIILSLREENSPLKEDNNKNKNMILSLREENSSLKEDNNKNKNLILSLRRKFLIERRQ